MKKRVIMILMLLVSITMILSSFARAQSADDVTESDMNSICSTANQQSVNELARIIREDEAKLEVAATPGDRAALESKINEETKELNSESKMLANCP